MTDPLAPPALTCPLCATTLEPREVDEAVVDVCPSCAGLWVDWFDGELVAIARHAPRVDTKQGERTSGGVPRCPRCRTPLAFERFTENAPDLLRCGECGGAFVSRATCDALAHPLPPSSKPGPFAGVVAALRGLFHASPPKRPRS